MRYLKCFLFLLLFYYIFACGSEVDTPPPAGVLEEEKMRRLILDMHLYEGLAYTQDMLPKDSMSKLNAYFTKAILLAHKVDDSTYKRSLYYYRFHPRKYRKIYKGILDSLKSLKP